MEQENNEQNNHVLGTRGQGNNSTSLLFSFTVESYDLTGNAMYVARKGYKEKHDLVVVYRSDEAYDGNEQQEDPHSDDPPDDVDAGHQAEALPPCCYGYEQQPHEL